MSAFTRTPPPPAAATRTDRSRGFEAGWRALRSDGLVPSREDFRPAKVIPFLKDIVLIEVGTTPRLSIRLVGTSVEARIQCSIAGRDYLEFLPEALRADAWRSSRQMVEHPCGLWQMSQLHYRRGVSHLIEMTMLPLRGIDGTDIIVVHCNPIAVSGSQAQLHSHAMRADPALTYQYIDIGAGVPADG